MFLQEHIDAPEALYGKGHLPQSIAKRALLKGMTRFAAKRANGS